MFVEGIKAFRQKILKRCWAERENLSLEALTQKAELLLDIQGYKIQW